MYLIHHVTIGGSKCFECKRQQDCKKGMFDPRLKLNGRTVYCIDEEPTLQKLGREFREITSDWK